MDLGNKKKLDGCGRIRFSVRDHLPGAPVSTGVSICVLDGNDFEGSEVGEDRVNIVLHRGRICECSPREKTIGRRGGDPEK